MTIRTRHLEQAPHIKSLSSGFLDERHIRVRYFERLNWLKERALIARRTRHEAADGGTSIGATSEEGSD
jgi:hypothetical protein